MRHQTYQPFSIFGFHVTQSPQLLLRLKKCIKNVIQLLGRISDYWNDGYSAIIKTNCIQFQSASCKFNISLNLLSSHGSHSHVENARCCFRYYMQVLTFKRVTSQLIIDFYGSRNTGASIWAPLWTIWYLKAFHDVVHTRPRLIRKNGTV